MIRREELEEAMFQALRLAATRMPPDIQAALERIREQEADPLGRRHVEVTLENARLAAEGKGLVCADTGYPLFYVRAGAGVQIEGGHGALWAAARAATEKATAQSFLRPTMVDPLQRTNPGNNVGPGMPDLHLELEGPQGLLEIVAAPKGGGSEIFGTFYRMMYPSDGRAGIMRFVIDCIREGCYAGKVCPPAIVGVGIGGTADKCMALAKRSALLRAVGTANPRADLQEMEQALLKASRELGLGPMGSQGQYAVLAVHIQCAMTHTAALPVAVNAQCSIGRRWRALLREGQAPRYTGDIDEAA